MWSSMCYVEGYLNVVVNTTTQTVSAYIQHGCGFLFQCKTPDSTTQPAAKTKVERVDIA